MIYQKTDLTSLSGGFKWFMTSQHGNIIKHVRIEMNNVNRIFASSKIFYNFFTIRVLASQIDQNENLYEIFKRSRDRIFTAIVIKYIQVLADP